MGVGFKGRKQKGSKAERDLIHMFWDSGFAAMRAAGSGSTKLPSADIIAGNGKFYFAIEAKTSASTTKYLEKEEITQLDLFANVFGARPLIAIKFDNEKWYFLTLTDLKLTKKSYAVSLSLAKEKGLLFEELIGKFHQEKLI